MDLLGNLQVYEAELQERQVVTPGNTDLIVTVSQAQTYLKQNYGIDTDEDSLIQSLINSSVENLQIYTGLTFASSTIKLWFEGFENVKIPYGPFITPVVATVRLVNKGVETEFTDYNLTGGSFKRILFDNLHSLNYYENEGWTIEFSAGYPSMSIPNLVKTAVKQDVAYWYYKDFEEPDGISPIAMQTINPLKRSV